MYFVFEGGRSRCDQEAGRVSDILTQPMVIYSSYCCVKRCNVHLEPVDNEELLGILGGTPMLWNIPDVNIFNTQSYRCILHILHYPVLWYPAL
jgi:hypothetical protein